MTTNPITVPKNRPDAEMAHAHIWCTQTGQNIALGDATDLHLRNLEAYLLRAIDAAEGCRIEILQPKFQGGFTGQEDRIESFNTTLEYVRIERRTRQSKEAALP